MALKQPTGTITLSAGAKRKRIVFVVPPEPWLEANDITLPRVEERIERWWRTDAALPDRDRRFFTGPKAVWPDPWPDRAFIAAVLYDSPDEREAQRMRSLRFVPSSWDIDDYEGSHATDPWQWMRTLTKDELRLVRRCIFLGHSFVANRMGCSRQYIQRCYREAIERAWYAAICQVRDRQAKVAARAPIRWPAARVLAAKDARANPARC